ncbi:MAG: hypothetical protein M9887_11835 [Chitinophagales bacterium]|nr:hypothetical protein [Chitinophagales bacterium]
MRRNLFVVLFCIAISSVVAQQSLMPLDRDYINRLDRYLSDPDVHFHSAVKPYIESEVLEAIPNDKWEEEGVADYNENFSPYLDSIGRVILSKGKEGFSLGWNRGDFLQLQREKVYIGINPIVDFSVGYDLKEKRALLGSEYGAQINASFGKKVSVGFAYRGLKEKSPEYIREFAGERGVMPGFGKVTWDGTALKTNDFNGYINFKPAKFINIQAGYGKHFWGDGYRSLLLSDYSPSYPYIAFDASVWKLRYTYMFNFLKDGSLATQENNFQMQKKYGVFHMLSLDAAKWLEISFFESVLWFHSDSSGVRGVEINYLNPMLFMRPVEFALGSPDNIALGFNIKFKPSKHLNIYSQVLLDDLDIKFLRLGKGFYRNKIAFQLGLKGFDLFKVSKLDAQLEINGVRPYVYAHKVPAQNYTHYNLPLAHPLGANFIELMAFLRYEKNKFYGNLKLQVARQGRDGDGQHNGSNIYRSDFDIAPNLDFAFNNSFLQGVKTKIVNAELRAGYLFNPRTNLSVEAILNYRKLSSSIEKQDNAYIGLGIRSNLFNRYKDF